MTAPTRICLVGAGAIAETHAEAISALKGLTLAALVEPNAALRDSFARRWSIPRAYPDIAAALAAGGFEAAHILTPPDLHAETASPFLRAGVASLVEKPLAANLAECDALSAAARAGGARLGVNQNFIRHPAFAALRRRLPEIGPLQHVALVYHAPLRQLASRQFGHWMFRLPVNILLEQAVHPLSQLLALGAKARVASARADAVETIGAGTPFLRAVSALIDCETFAASLSFRVGASFPVWTLTAYGTDGALVADMFNARCYAFARTQWLEAVDAPLSAARTAGGIFGAALAGSARYALSLLRIGKRSDGFFRSMRDSIAAFHDAQRAFEADAGFARELVEICETIAAAATPATPEPAALPRRTIEACDVVILGGTGFIGAHLTRALIGAGYSVRVMARNAANLDPVFAQDCVSVLRGDIRKREDVERAVAGARFVVNLAHGGGGASYAAISEAMTGGARIVAQACLDHSVERLVHVGSIASLYLGADAGVVFDNAAADPKSERRADYARAKAETDRMLLDMRREKALPVVLMRPGLVVGAGTAPLHSGLGVFNNEQHCVGWNAGRNALPFVLASDVAQAIARALTAPGIAGRSYNLVGDVRPSAREYIAALAQASGRPLRFHANGPTRLWLADIGKWAIKRIGGRKAPFPSRRDLVSRGLAAPFDTSQAKRDLGWTPETDPARFYAAAFAGVARPSS